MGRKKVPPNQRCDKPVTFMMTAADRKKLYAAAKRNKMTYSEYCRFKVMRD